MRVGKISSFCVFVHIIKKVFDSHLGGSVPYGREPQAHLLGWSLYSLRGEVVEYAGCEAGRFVKDAVYLCELWVCEDSEVGGMVF